jgi:hypothetical protein
MISLDHADHDRSAQNPRTLNPIVPHFQTNKDVPRSLYAYGVMSDPDPEGFTASNDGDNSPFWEEFFRRHSKTNPFDRDSNSEDDAYTSGPLVPHVTNYT